MNHLTKKQKQLILIERLASSRSHKVIKGDHSFFNSELIVFCTLHKKTHFTTYHKYKKTKLGCLCCAQAVWKSPRSKTVCDKISKAQKNKVKNYTCWLKGKTGPNHPAYKHGKGNLRANTESQLLLLNNWKQQVLKFYNYKCFITGVINTHKTPLACHHLESWDINPEFRFNCQNGVVISKKIHTAFHKKYGFGQNTTLQFEKFCEETFNINKFPWKYGNHEPSITSKVLKLENQTKKNKQELNFIELCKSRGHLVRENNYETCHSRVVIFCSKHNQKTITTYTTYKKSKFGCLGCARKKQSTSVSKANRLRRKKD